MLPCVYGSFSWIQYVWERRSRIGFHHFWKESLLKRESLLEKESLLKKEFLLEKESLLKKESLLEKDPD